MVPPLAVGPGEGRRVAFFRPGGLSIFDGRVDKRLAHKRKRKMKSKIRKRTKSRSRK
jgi:hypothetical protein